MPDLLIIPFLMIVISFCLQVEYMYMSALFSDIISEGGV